jgi:segregation and condensation protein A
MGYAVSLQGFEGPMDLLIHLIQKNKIDICDIPIAAITNEYLAQIKTWQDMDMEIASDFIVMAARLLEIKAKALLPQNKEPGEDEEDIQAKLVRQLVEYKVFKEISAYLKSREERELGAVYRDPEYIPVNEQETPLEIDPVALEHCFKRLLFQQEEEAEVIAPPQKIIRELFSIEEKILEITEALIQAGNQGVSFSDLLHPDITRDEVVVTLLSLLEMVKTSGLRLVQNRVFIDFQIEREVENNG